VDSCLENVWAVAAMVSHLGRCGSGL